MDKVCKTCLIIKKFENFPKHAQMADGHLNFCKDCIALRNGVKSRRINIQGYLNSKICCIL